MTYSTNLGTMVPGVVAQRSAGGFYGIPATSSGQGLISTGANTYSCTGPIGASSSGCLANLVVANPPSTGVTPTYTTTYAYNSAAQFLVLTVTPTYTTSTFYALFSATMNMVPTTGGIILTVSGFLNATGTAIVTNQVNDGSGTNQFTQQTGGSSLGFQTGALTPFTVNFCFFKSMTTSSSTGLAANDGFTVLEINSGVINSMLPVFYSPSATPVLVVKIPSTTINTSTQVTGTIWAADNANVNSNEFGYSFVMQQGSSLGVAPTIANGAVIVNALNASTSLTFTPAVGGVNIYFNGINGSTFIGQESYQVVT